MNRMKAAKSIDELYQEVNQGLISIRGIELIPLETIRNRCLRKTRGAEAIEEA